MNIDSIDYSFFTKTKNEGENMQIHLVKPHSTEEEYGEFMDREKPQGIDQKRAECLLSCLTPSNVSELRSWRSDAQELLKTIVSGRVQHGVIPHKVINTISIHFGLKWDGRSYVR